MSTKPLVHLVVNDKRDDKREIVVEALREKANDLGFLSDIRTIRVFGSSIFRDICSQTPTVANAYLGANEFINPNSGCIDPLNMRYTSVMYAQIAEEQYQRALPIEEKAREIARKDRERREIASYFPEDGEAD